MYETSSENSEQITARYTLTPEGKLLSVNYVAENKDYYYHYNAQGDVVAVTDSNGALYRQYSYDNVADVLVAFTLIVSSYFAIVRYVRVTDQRKRVRKCVRRHSFSP